MISFLDMLLITIAVAHWIREFLPPDTLHQKPIRLKDHNEWIYLVFLQSHSSRNLLQYRAWLESFSPLCVWEWLCDCYTKVGWMGLSSMYKNGVCDVRRKDTIASGHMKNQFSNKGQQKEWAFLTCLSFYITTKMCHDTRNQVLDCTVLSPTCVNTVANLPLLLCQRKTYRLEEYFTVLN